MEWTLKKNNQKLIEQRQAVMESQAAQERETLRLFFHKIGAKKSQKIMEEIAIGKNSNDPLVKTICRLADLGMISLLTDWCFIEE
jgi:predicted metal-dependent hydrolase